MKTIAVVKKEFQSKGGLEKAALRIIQALQKRGADVTLLAEKVSQAPCPVLSHPPHSMLKFLRLKEFDTWCKEAAQKFDIVLSMDRCSFQTYHRAGNGVHAAYLELREGFFKKLSFKINPLHRMILKLEKATFEDPHLRGIIVNSHLVKNQILHHYSTPAEKIHVIHNGVEWHEMEADFNATFPHQSSKLEFLFVGHNFERKGLLPLLQALHALKRRDFHLSVVGTDKHLESYKRTCEKLGLKTQVTFFGAQENIRPFYQKADALVIPSIYDPFANVTVEALAMGLFVVSSQTNGGHEVLTPESGVVGLENLEKAFDHPKTLESAKAIRNSVKYLDYASQLEKVCNLCLS